MKKNGFIATSLIYSFFLIFITLFLTIILDYLQQRVLLNEAEAGVKVELYKVLGVKDFVAGDFISFDNGCTGNEVPASNKYVVANVIVDDATKCGGTYSDCLILYGFELNNSATPNLTKTLIENDIDDGIKNATFLNDILYTFSGADSYNIGSSLIVSKVVDNTCNNDFKTDKGCIKSGTSSKIRTRKIYRFEDQNIKKCGGHRGSYILDDSI